MSCLFRITEALDNLVTLLTPQMELVSTCMVDMIDQDLFSILPVTIQAELLTLSEENLSKLPSFLFTAVDISEDTPQLNEILKKLRQHSLESLGLVTDEECDDDPGLLEFWDKIMSEKKTHEVCEMAKFVIHHVQKYNIESLVDLGSGKAYLSQVLSTMHNIPVLAIDSKEGNTRGAEVREKNLKAKWAALEIRATERKDGHVPSNRKKRAKNKHKKVKVEEGGNLNDSSALPHDHQLVTLTQYVEDGADIGDLIDKNFPTKNKNYGLIGLHTCGNLATTSLRTFLTSPGCKFICNVGCCYNHLTEDVKGFPLSKHLQNRQLTLPRLARMLAVQPLERLATSNTLPNKSLLWRAVLEMILHKVAPDLPKEERVVGRIAVKSKNFVDYARRAFAKLKVESDLSDSALSELFNKYEMEFGSKLNCFYQYRALFSPLVEAVILTDRLLFMKEQGINNTSLVKLFDSTISPRSYAIVSTK